MKLKSFLATTAMLLSLAAIGSARSWDITVAANTKAGNVILPAGNYNVKVDKDQVQFMSIDNGKKFTVPAKIENGATKKYDQTEMKIEKEGDTNVIRSIELGGTTEDLKFGE
jgi:hypothetical protein